MKLGLPVVLLVAAFFQPACGRTPEPSESEAENHESPQLVSAAEQPAPQVVDVVWLPSGSGEAATMTARIFNNDAETKAVVVELVGIDPYGREVTRALGSRKLAPKSTFDLSVPVRDLPAQSVGHPSAASVAVSYDLEVHQPDGASETIRHKVHSPVAYVTFSDDFRLAVARTVADQARATRGAVAKDARLQPLAQVKKLRHYDARYDRIDELRAVPEEAEPPALYSVSDEAPVVPAGTPPGMKGVRP